MSLGLTREELLEELVRLGLRDGTPADLTRVIEDVRDIYRAPYSVTDTTRRERLEELLRLGERDSTPPALRRVIEALEEEARPLEDSAELLNPYQGDDDDDDY